MENLFDALCASLMLPANRKKFLDGEGLQLMNLMLREKKESRESALKVRKYFIFLFSISCHEIQLWRLSTSTLRQLILITQTSTPLSLFLSAFLDEQWLSYCKCVNFAGPGSRNDRPRRQRELRQIRGNPGSAHSLPLVHEIASCEETQGHEFGWARGACLCRKFAWFISFRKVEFLFNSFTSIMLRTGKILFWYLIKVRLRIKVLKWFKVCLLLIQLSYLVH